MSDTGRCPPPINESQIPEPLSAAPNDEPFEDEKTGRAKAMSIEDMRLEAVARSAALHVVQYIGERIGRIEDALGPDGQVAALGAKVETLRAKLSEMAGEIRNLRQGLELQQEQCNRRHSNGRDSVPPEHAHGNG